MIRLLQDYACSIVRTSLSISAWCVWKDHLPPGPLRPSLPTRGHGAVGRWRAMGPWRTRAAPLWGEPSGDTCVTVHWLDMHRTHTHTHTQTLIFFVPLGHFSFDSSAVNVATLKYSSILYWIPYCKSIFIIITLYLQCFFFPYLRWGEVLRQF